ncbi:MAG: hypothetical protein AB1896_13190, partial [Thermodesulfobacteriota bacterium]
MSIEELLGRLQQIDLWLLLVLFLAPPVLVPVLGLLHRGGDGGRNPWRYFYSLLVFWASLPGVLACLLTAYSLFFIRRNLLEVNVILYFFPIASMIVTLV